MPPLNWKQDLEESLFNNNSKCEDFECDSAYVNHRIKGVFDKSRDEEMSQMSCDEYPCSEETKKKTCGQKEGGKSKTTSIQLWLIFLKYIFEFLYLPYSWSGFDSQLSVFNHIIFLFGLFPFILTPGLFQPREVFELNVFLVTFI